MSSLREESDPILLDETIVRPRRALFVDDTPIEQQILPPRTAAKGQRRSRAPAKQPRPSRSRQRPLEREDWKMLSLIALVATSFGMFGGLLFVWIFT
jgi:hypothetical protein